MELTVRTLTGEHVLADVEPECTPRELAARLHDTAGDAVPPPERQRLVRACTLYYAQVTVGF